MILGSHNSLTYLKPKKWYHYLMLPFAKCQSKDLLSQYKNNIRYFDIRCRFDKKDMSMIICHGLCEFNLNIKIGNVYKNKFNYWDFIEWITEYLPKNDKIIFRLVLETNKIDSYQEYFFKNFCRTFQKIIKEKSLSHEIFECTRKFDWKQLYKTNLQLKEFQHISSYPKYKESIKVRWYEKICPYLYSKRTNKQFWKNINNLKNYDIISYDFI